MADILIAGGVRDTNLAWLKAAADRLGVDAENLSTGPDGPEFSWRPGEAASVGGRQLAFRAAFLRYDVFESMARGTQGASASALAWYAAAWALCTSTGAFTFNRTLEAVSGSKPAMLVLAERHGLNIPRTLVTNSLSRARGFSTEGDAIAKPVAGGAYATTLDDAIERTPWTNDCSPSPAIVQEYLSYPETRIYRVGGDFFAFDIASETLDSRLDTKCRITPVDLATVDATLLAQLMALTDAIKCDFCAVDMKTDPRTGEPVFLELNTGPMFMGYDKTCDGVMAEHMIRYLVAGASA